MKIRILSFLTICSMTSITFSQSKYKSPFQLDTTIGRNLVLNTPNLAFPLTKSTKDLERYLFQLTSKIKGNNISYNMPIYKPEGNYPMNIQPIDAKKKYPIQIFEPK